MKVIVHGVAVAFVAEGVLVRIAGGVFVGLPVGVMVGVLHAPSAISVREWLAKPDIVPEPTAHSLVGDAAVTP